MIFVIFGPDTIASRKKLTELATNAGNIIRLDGNKVTFSELDEALSSKNLFVDKKTVIIEDFSKLKPEKNVWELLLSYESDNNANIILWDDTDLSKKKFSEKVRVFKFEFPKYYYSFIDNFYPKSEKSFELFQNVLKTLNSEQVLSGLLRRIRQLLLIKSSSYSKSAEFKRMQSWQIGKLKKQADFWNENDLEKVFFGLADLEERLKTSNLSMPLANHLDILILSDLN